MRVNEAAAPFPLLHDGGSSSLASCVRLSPPPSSPAQGRFAFTTTVGGEYQLCFATNSSRWFGQVRVAVPVVLPA